MFVANILKVIGKVIYVTKVFLDPIFFKLDPVRMSVIAISYTVKNYKPVENGPPGVKSISLLVSLKK